MKTVLVFVPNYFPGYKSGGVARTVLNTTEWLSSDFRFFIVTRDRDLGSDVPYENIESGTWVPFGKARVRYLKPDELSLDSLAELVRSTAHDILHLNGFFDPVFTIKLLLLRRLKKISPRRVLLSPRGDFLNGSLRLKYPKKKLYIELSRIAGFYKKLCLHGSTRHEADSIAAALRVPVSSVRTAIDLPIKEASFAAQADASSERLRVVYLSRMSREKNLDGALKVLQRVKTPIVFDMIGPQEDPVYWEECRALLSQLPGNVEANYLGPVAPEEVFDTLARYDVFLFPSHNENYGHVIAESVAVGTRVLIGQGTPWRNLDSDGLGWDIDLKDVQRFVDVIETLSRQSPAERAAVRSSVREAAAARLSHPAALEDNRLLYLNA